MYDFQVKYHFDADSKDSSGETVLELISSTDIEGAARTVEQAMTQPTFAVRPCFGPAKDCGLVIIHTPAVRYVEITPSPRPVL